MFSELHILPYNNKKCFFRDRDNEWKRGFIEFVNQEDCRIRDLDFGNLKRILFENVYPHRRLSSFSDNPEDFKIPKYLAIRCVLSRNSARLDNKQRLHFERITGGTHNHNQVILKKFSMIEQVTVDDRKCWFTILRDSERSSTSINDDVLRISTSQSCSNNTAAHQIRIPQSMSNDVITKLRIKEDESNAAPGALSLQHHNFNSHQQKAIESGRQWDRPEFVSSNAAVCRSLMVGQGLLSPHQIQAQSCSMPPAMHPNYKGTDEGKKKKRVKKAHRYHLVYKVFL